MFAVDINRCDGTLAAARQADAYVCVFAFSRTVDHAPHYCNRHLFNAGVLRFPIGHSLLGVQELQPLISERSLTHNTARKRRLHWQGVAKSACEQCGSAIIPQVANPIALHEIEKIGKDDKAIVCCFETQTSIKTQADKLLAKSSEQEAMVHLMVGPEGGFSSDEVSDAMSLGFEPVRLGNSVLRSETAVVAALSFIRFLHA